MNAIKLVEVIYTERRPGAWMTTEEYNSRIAITDEQSAKKYLNKENYSIKKTSLGAVIAEYRWDKLKLDHTCTYDIDGKYYKILPEHQCQAIIESLENDDRSYRFQKNKIDWYTCDESNIVSKLYDDIYNLLKQCIIPDKLKINESTELKVKTSLQSGETDNLYIGTFVKYFYYSLPFTDIDARKVMNIFKTVYNNFEYTAGLQKFTDIEAKFKDALVYELINLKPELSNRKIEILNALDRLRLIGTIAYLRFDSNRFNIMLQNLMKSYPNYEICKNDIISLINNPVKTGQYFSLQYLSSLTRSSDYPKESSREYLYTILTNHGKKINGDSIVEKFLEPNKMNDLMVLKFPQYNDCQIVSAGYRYYIVRQIK